MIATHPKTVVMVSKEMPPVEYSHSNKSSFMSGEFYEDHCHSIEVNLATINI